MEKKKLKDYKKKPLCIRRVLHWKIYGAREKADMTKFTKLIQTPIDRIHRLYIVASEFRDENLINPTNGIIRCQTLIIITEIM